MKAQEAPQTTASVVQNAHREASSSGTGGAARGLVPEFPVLSPTVSMPG